MEKRGEPNGAPRSTQDSMSSSDFVSGFVSAMATEGYTVEAEISVLPLNSEP